MNIEQEKMIVEALPSLYPLKDYEEDAIHTVLEALPHWIPVTERLPEADGSYLVSGKWGSGKESVGDCEFSVEDGYFQTAWNFDVLAWCELPEPYKGGDGMSQSKKIPVTCGECDFSAYSEVQNSLVCTKDDNILCVRQDQRYAYCPLFNVTKPLFNKERARLYLGLELPTNVPTVREVTE